jgi:outer membrane putative beta-barrel porin/alpha-amylase
VRALAAVGLALLLPLGPAWAADEPEPISPDRAGAATNASPVGRGVLQLETGLVYGRERVANSPDDRRFTVETAIRAGLTERLELQVQAEPVVRLRGADDATDHGDIGLGAKYRLLGAAGESWWPALAVLPFVILPVTEPPIGTGKTDLGALVLASFTLPGQVSLDVDAGFAANGQRRPGGFLLQAIVAAGASRDLAGDVTLFSDVVYASRHDRAGRDSVQLDTGVIWRPARDVALDASGVTSLAGRGPDWAVRAGVSVRFGR